MCQIKVKKKKFKIFQVKQIKRKPLSAYVMDY